MKKEIKKLSLNKKTISNLNSSEMNRLIGGSQSWRRHCPDGEGKTKNGNTCPGHNTCNSCFCYTVGDTFCGIC